MNHIKKLIQESIYSEIAAFHNVSQNKNAPHSSQGCNISLTNDPATELQRSPCSANTSPQRVGNLNALSSVSYITLPAMLMLNIQGMTPSPSPGSKSYWKLPYLKELIDDSSDFIPFISLTETWVKRYISDAQLELSGYYLFCADRKSRGRGGAALYIHNSITVNEFWSFDNKFCEVGIAHLKSSSTAIVVLYRPPGVHSPIFLKP